LGLDIGTSLQITNCFPFPSASPSDPENPDENQINDDLYQVEMMRCLREVNVDNNTVGWYSSTNMGSFVSATTIETLFAYQDKIKKSIVLIYDPLKTNQGSLSLKAYRLSQKFLKVYKNGAQSFNKEAVKKANLTFLDIFEEFPLTITNSPLVNAYLFELQEQGHINFNFQEFDLDSTPYLEKNLELLMNNFDSLAQQQNNFAYYQRALARQQAQLEKIRAQNAVRMQMGEELLSEDVSAYGKQEPNRLEYLLSANQIENYCKQVDKFAANNLVKLFLQSSLWKN